MDAGLTGGFNLVLFPNLVLLRSQIRIIRPIAVDRTKMYTNVVRLQGVPEEVNLRRMRDQEFEFGAAGTFYTDDMEIFERSTRASERRSRLGGVRPRPRPRTAIRRSSRERNVGRDAASRDVSPLADLMTEQPAMAAAG